MHFIVQMRYIYSAKLRICNKLHLNKRIELGHAFTYTEIKPPFRSFRLDVWYPFFLISPTRHRWEKTAPDTR